MDSDHLSKRLQVVAAYVPVGTRLADIGTDHAYLPVALLKAGRIEGGVAGEVVAGPFENARREIQRAGFQQALHARLANGLAAIRPTDQIETLVMAGMGGTLMATILDDRPQALTGISRLILQPNVGEEVARAALARHGFALVAESILTEDAHTYEILVADRSDEPVAYSQRERQFGPFLLAERSPIFLAKWQRELARQRSVLAAIQQAKVVPAAKVATVETTIRQIEEMLNHD